MSGHSNLPPGVTDSMLPGNRPEDLAFEAFCEKFIEHLPCQDFPDGYFDEMLEWVWKQMDESYGNGYKAGCADEQMNAAQSRKDSEQRLALIAVEFGFRQCEKGYNFEMALTEARKLIEEARKLVDE